MSSYEQHNYDLVFKALVFSLSPKKIVEIGVFNGFSLDCFINSSNENCKIYAYDLFEDYEYRHQRFKKIKKQYSTHKNVYIAKMDFKEVYNYHSDNSIDILHVDISNNGDTYRFAMDNYMPKVSKNGIMILEGGSHQRDNCEWMEEFKFPKITPAIKEINKKHSLLVLEPHPSLTIIRK